jgi:hypothetical protein
MTRPAEGPAAGPSAPDGQSSDCASPADRPRWPRFAWAAGAVVAVAGLSAAYIRLSATYPVNSDGANIVLMASDMRHGNVLLHSWVMSDVPFWTTELPQYALIELIRGLGPDVTHIAAAMTYTLALVLATLLAQAVPARTALAKPVPARTALAKPVPARTALAKPVPAKPGAAGAEGLARVLLPAGIMLAPQLGVGIFVLVLSVGHIGTSVPLLVTWLVLDRLRPRWYVPVLAGFLLAWAAIADSLVLLAGIGPLAAVTLIRAARTLLTRQGWRAARHDLSLAAAALAATGIWAGSASTIKALGGYTLHQVPFQFIAWSALGAHARTTGLSLLALFGASFRGVQPGTGIAFAILHLAGLALATVALGVVIGRFFRRGLVDQVLAVAIVANLIVYLISNFSNGVLNTREIAVVLPFAAALAGRTLAPYLARPWLARPAPQPQASHQSKASLKPRRAWRGVAPVLLAVLAGYAAGLGCQLTQPTAPPANARLADWLLAHHLTHGLSGYWQSSSVTLDSAGRVTIRPLVTHFTGVVPYEWEAKRTWFDWRTQYASFVVLDDQPGFFTYWAPAHQLQDVFGTPAATYRTGPYTILVWHQNLLLTLHQWEQAVSQPR